MEYEAPLRIAIPTPTDLPIGYGVNSTGKRGGNLRVRCTNKEYDAIQHEAVLLGMTLAMFTRHCAVHVAAQLSKHRKAESTSMVIGEQDELFKPKRRAKRKKASGKSK
jgi:hypothetical protein